MVYSAKRKNRAGQVRQAEKNGRSRKKKAKVRRQREKLQMQGM
jgi:hypothetical protein